MPKLVDLLSPVMALGILVMMIAAVCMRLRDCSAWRAEWARGGDRIKLLARQPSDCVLTAAPEARYVRDDGK